MTAHNHPNQWRPPWLKLPLEARAVVEYLRMPRSFRPQDNWPTGQGQPVLVIPGFGQNETSMAPLVRILNAQGFAAQDWGLGRNSGIKRGMTQQLMATLEQLEQANQRPVALLGWSLGGVLARELARKAPHLVSRVISLGSPIAGGHCTTLQPLFGWLNPATRGQGHDPQRYQPPPVPCTAIYSRSDGIVNWRAAREPDNDKSENIQVGGSHLGLGFNPKVWHIICHRLSPQTAHEVYQN